MRHSHWVAVPLAVGLGLWTASCGGQSSSVAAADGPAASPCGLEGLYVVCHLRGVEVGYDRLAGLLRPGADGRSTLADLERAALAVGLRPVSARVGPERLPALPMPAIVQFRSLRGDAPADHFVVLLGADRDGVVLLDPPRPAARQDRDSFSRRWTGVVLTFPEDRDREARLRAALGRSRSRAAWVRRVGVAVVVAAVGYVGTFRWAGGRRRVVGRPG